MACTATQPDPTANLFRCVTETLLRLDDSSPEDYARFGGPALSTALEQVLEAPPRCPNRIAIGNGKTACPWTREEL